ncbi:MAG TPA: SRPBCC family protein, partial [Kofleriaceae bacterium]
MRSLLIIAFTSVVGVAAAAPPPGVTMSQPADTAMTEGEVTVDGDPASVFAAAQDYARWNELMPDVAKVEIKSKKGDEAMVTLVSPTGHRDNLHFRNTPQARLIFFEDTGNHGRADVWAEIVFAPAESQAQTKVHIRLYA